jgi:hypothetical protein
MPSRHTSIARKWIQKAAHCNLQETPVAPIRTPGGLGRETIFRRAKAKTQSQFRTNFPCDDFR